MCDVGREIPDAREFCLPRVDDTARRRGTAWMNVVISSLRWRGDCGSSVLKACGG